MFDEPRVWRAVSGVAAVVLLVALFFPWARDCASSPGPCQSTDGWDPVLGVLTGLLAFGLVAALRLGLLRLAREVGLGLAFFAMALMLRLRPYEQHQGSFGVERHYGYAAYVGVAAAAVALVGALAWSAGGRKGLADGIPSWARFDRL